MRKLFAYEKYLLDMDRYFSVRKEPLPEPFCKALRYVGFWHEYLRFSLRGSSLQSIEKLWFICNGISSDDPVFSDLPSEFRPLYKNTYDVLHDLYRIFIVDKDPVYVIGKEITKAGGKKINEIADRLNDCGWPLPPENELTNAIRKITYSGGENYGKCKTGLDIEVFKHISVATENGSLYDPLPYVFFGMTVDLMEKLIPLLQWDRIEPYLREGSCREENGSGADDPAVIYVSAYGLSCRLDLLNAAAENPFIKILKLVWDEYGESFKEKRIDLPWFKMLGWEK